MSDLADREQDSTAAVAGAGGSFARRGGEAARGRLQDCACGGRPRYLAASPMYGQPCEFLGCPACGYAVGPYPSRQTLATAWRLGSGAGAVGEVHGSRFNGSEART